MDRTVLKWLDRHAKVVVSPGEWKWRKADGRKRLIPCGEPPSVSLRVDGVSLYTEWMRPQGSDYGFGDGGLPSRELRGWLPEWVWESLAKEYGVDGDGSLSREVVLLDEFGDCLFNKLKWTPQEHWYGTRCRGDVVDLAVWTLGLGHAAHLDD